MDTDALKLVALVAQHGSFAAAARVLNLDPSSVSRTVAGVEAELNLRLFQRTTRSLRITEEGETYLQRVVPLLEELDHAREAAGQIRQEPTGRLRLTASVAFAQVCIVPQLGPFHDAYPEITVELLPTDANMDLQANGIDLAIRLAPAPKGDLISTRLRRTVYRVCAAPDYLSRAKPITEPADLSAHPCLRFDLPAFRDKWRFRRGTDDPFDVDVTGWAVIGNALALRQAARDGLGPVLLGDWLVDDDIRAGRLVDLFPDHECTATDFDTAAWALYPSRSYLPRKVRLMIDFLRARVGG